MTWKQDFSKEELQHMDHLALELEKEIMDALKEWCVVHEVGEFTPPVSCGAALMVAGIITSNAYRHYGGPGLHATVETFTQLWELKEETP